MGKRSPLGVKCSDAQKPFSSLWWLENKCLVSTKLSINPLWSQMLISEKTFSLTSFSVVELPCSQESLKDWQNKLPACLQNQWRLKFWLPQKENSLFGLVDLFSVLFQLSKICGSQKLSIKKVEPKLFTENVFDWWISISYNKFSQKCKNKLKIHIVYLKTKVNCTKYYNKFDLKNVIGFKDKAVNKSIPLSNWPNIKWDRNSLHVPNILATNVQGEVPEHGIV